MPARFRSKVDLLLAAPLAVAIPAPAVLAVVRLATGHPVTYMNVVFIALSLLLASMVFISYTVTAEAIVVRRGLVSQRMPLERVRELRATREATSSPALSFDRIAIQTDRGLWLLVSPKDKAAFVRAVKAGNPSVALSGFAGDMGPA